MAAANEAGGRDNVTVVYAEAPGFRGAQSRRATPARSRRRAVGRRDAATVPAPRRRSAGRASVGSSRTAWFAVARCSGCSARCCSHGDSPAEPPVGGRTIVAAPQASETIGTLAAAVQSARAGDVMRLEPGTYAESIVVPEGVSVRARVPEASVFVRPASATGEWVPSSARGEPAAPSPECGSTRPLKRRCRSASGSAARGDDRVAPGRRASHGRRRHPRGCLGDAAGQSLRRRRSGRSCWRRAASSMHRQRLRASSARAAPSGHLRMHRRERRPAITCLRHIAQRLRRLRLDADRGPGRGRAGTVRAANVIVSADPSTR